MAKLLSIKDLRTGFETSHGRLWSVDQVSFDVEEGEIIGIVGESGCGKSVTALSIMRLFEPESGARIEGRIDWAGTDLLSLSDEAVNDIRGSEIAMIFQDPMSSLNPVFTVGAQVMEPLILHQGMSRRAARARALELLKQVGIPAPERRIAEYPHQLSGGMRQRVMIAISMACNPRLLIADEPTTALDVTIQAQILDLMTRLQRESGMAILMITHDLGVVSEVCNRVIVMYLGEIVEEIPVDTLFEGVRHPYTIGLMASMPGLSEERQERLVAIPGQVPALADKPTSCRFAARCAWAEARCLAEHPPLEAIEPGHSVRCFRHAETRR